MDVPHVVKEDFKKEYVLSPTTPGKPAPSRPYYLSDNVEVLDGLHHLNSESPPKALGASTQKSVQPRKKHVSKRYRPKIQDGSKPKKLSKSQLSRKHLDNAMTTSKSAKSSIPASETGNSPIAIPNSPGLLTPNKPDLTPNTPDIPEPLIAEHSPEPLIVEHSNAHAKSCRRSLDFSKDRGLDLDLSRQYVNKGERTLSLSLGWDLNFTPKDFEDCDTLKKIVNQFYDGKCRTQGYDENERDSVINGGDHKKLDQNRFCNWKKTRLKRRSRVCFDKLNDMFFDKQGVYKRREIALRYIIWSLSKKKRSPRKIVRSHASMPQPISPHTEANVELEAITYPRANDVLQTSCPGNGVSSSSNISRNLATGDLETSKNDFDTHTENGIEDPSPKILSDAINQQFEPLVGDEVLQQMVSYHDKNGALVPHKRKRKKPRAEGEVELEPEVDIDPETMEMCKLITEYGEITSVDEAKVSEKWRKEQEIFRGRAESFIALMHQLLGNRRFTPWKGSVIDSVVGTFLTQNVSDYLSSSAFMSLRARYPIKPKGNDKEKKTCINCYAQKCTEVHEETNYASSELSKVCETRPQTESLSASKVGSNDLEKIGIVREILQVEENDFLEQFYDYHQSEKVSSDLVEKLPSQSTSEELAEKKAKPRSKSRKIQEETQPVDWDQLRKTYSSRSMDGTTNSLDSVDWEAVRQAPVEDIEATIQKRGQQNILSIKIKALLDRLVKDHGSTDLEWLRDVPPEKAKEFLLSIHGLGQKSVECIRLLTLHHKAFPVDTNVGRIAVRLGWIPLKPLPKDIELHVLSEYPPMDQIQKYLWPRLCNLDQRTLYEFHYQLITFGKVFCVKRSPNCDGCPKQDECRHKASQDASNIKKIEGPRSTGNLVSAIVESTHFPELASKDKTSSREAEDPHSVYDDDIDFSQPLMTLSREQALELEALLKALNKPEETPLMDIEDLLLHPKKDEGRGLNPNKAGRKFQKHVGNSSQSLVTVSPEKASMPNRKLKDEQRLRTEHEVYELPDDHTLLTKVSKREVDDPCPYMLAAIRIGESSKSSSESTQDLDLNKSPSSESTQDLDLNKSPSSTEDNTVHGIILHPSRTALKGNFPLNGTYFQVNEVFADFASSKKHIVVPGSWLCYLTRRTLFCGTSITSIIKGLSLEEVQRCFCEQGFICVRGFDVDTDAPRHLPDDLHRLPTSKNRKPEEWWG